MNNLFEGSDDEGDDLQLTTNQDYAKTYNNLRKKELLQKYKDRGLDVSESEFDSDSESSEEDEVDPKFDQDFFKTLSSLKSKDPRIYDKETRFFNESSSDEGDKEGEGEASPKKKKKSKPVTLKDYERKVILEHNGKFESSDEEKQEKEEEEYQRAQSPTAVEEERRLKDEFRNVMNQEDDGEDEEFGGIFKKRSKTKEQTEAEEADFTKWLAGQQENIQDTDKKQLEPLKQYWNSSKLTQGESFLRDYILNKGYAKTDESAIPTYDEIVGETAPLSEDEQELEKQAEFEHKYNFRFEEPDAEFIKRYPRTVEQSIRRTDDKRKEKRKELKERKEQEKQQKMKELDLIKEMKRKEIEEKIRKLKAVTGNDELGFRDDELEEDFDPAAHDRRMQELFNDEYYNVDEGEEKPECPSDIDELVLEDWDNYDPRQHKDGGDEDYEGHCEDDDFNMDCDYDPSTAKQQLQQELIESTRGRKGRKGRRNRFMEMIQAEKPAFNPEDEKTYGEYIDEYYQLDCEDIIGDQPCRFKYVETTPNDFGLTIEEILLAKNKELNQWASLKKAVQTRPEHVEKKEQRLYKMKAKNEDLKRKIFKSLYGEGSDDEDQATGHTSSAQPAAETPTPAESSQNPTESLSKSKRKRLKRKAAAAAAATSAQNPKDESKEVQQPKEANESQAKDDSPAPKKSKQEQGAQANVPPQQTQNKSEKNKINKGKKAPKTTANQTENHKQNSEKKTENALQKSNGKNPFNKPQNRPNSKPGQPPKLIANGTENQKQNKSEKKTETPTQKSETANGNNPFNKQQKKPNSKPGQAPFNNKKGNAKQGPNPFKKSEHKPSGAKKTHNFKAKNKINKNSSGITDDRLKAYGINPRKFHKREKYGKKEN
ncbi:protein KRI1 homolog [Drosophila kikkawai]|uniref:Protein KRI1 homolog n=1 Tax=Drosophila kikkawai TaxID=30033 RepID=A0A6P4HY63_DROKI|nr:protein KRI1 homolog [Drosophila kikkawai]